MTDHPVVLFRIVHISDLHIGVRPLCTGILKIGHHWKSGTAPKGLYLHSTHDPALLLQLGRHLHREQAQIDLVVATGDIGTTGHVADQVTARDLVYGHAHLGIGSARVPKKLVPGNHDRFYKSTEFDHIFSAVMDNKEYVWEKGHGAKVLAVLDISGTRLAILGADFSLFDPGDANTPSDSDWRNEYGKGRVYPTILQELVDLTADVRTAHGEMVVMWALHFAPEIKGGHLPRKLLGLRRYLELIDGGGLIQEASRNRVYAILCGHVHNPCSYTMNNVRICLAGTLSEYYPRFGNWFHTIEIEIAAPDRVTSAQILDYCWSHTQNDWVRTRKDRVLGIE